MNALYSLQFASCIVTAMLAMMLMASRLQMRWLNRRYEVSRWLISGSMLILSSHYVLQMLYGFRAASDKVGAVVNILFYTPIAIVISYAIFNVICYREGRRLFRIVGAVFYLLILAAFLLGVLLTGNFDIGFMLYVMLAMFLACMCYCIVVTSREIRHHRKIIEEDSGEDLLPYDRYTWASYLLMATSVLLLVGGIMYRPLLFVVGPLMLFSLFIFTMSFIGYGFNMVPLDVMLEENNDTSLLSVEENEDVEQGETVEDMERNLGGLSVKRVNEIEKALADWCAKGGFRDSMANMPSLLKKVDVSRDELTMYFEKCLNSSFRVWLSDVRFQDAQRMLRENPYYSNDTISSECGFSSHAHLYKVFKAKTGLTPGKWKESVLGVSNLKK